MAIAGGEQVELAEYTYPDFYKLYPWVPIERQIEEFVGREGELQIFWDELCRIAGKSPFQKQNLAYIGQRKLGKTAFLRRCYELVFGSKKKCCLSISPSSKKAECSCPTLRKRSL